MVSFMTQASHVNEMAIADGSKIQQLVADYRETGPSYSEKMMVIGRTFANCAGLTWRSSQVLCSAHRFNLVKCWRLFISNTKTYLSEIRITIHHEKPSLVPSKHGFQMMSDWDLAP